MNSVTTNAVKAVNESRMAEAEAKVARLINNIDSQREVLKAHAENIASAQARLKELADRTLTIGKVFGEARLPDNANGVTIGKVIDSINKARQASVEVESNCLINRIASEQDSIAAANKEIARLVEEIGKVQVENLTVAEVVGS